MFPTDCFKFNLSVIATGVIFKSIGKYLTRFVFDVFFSVFCLVVGAHGNGGKEVKRPASLDVKALFGKLGLVDTDVALWDPGASVMN